MSSPRVAVRHVTAQARRMDIGTKLKPNMTTPCILGNARSAMGEAGNRKGPHSMKWTGRDFEIIAGVIRTLPDGIRIEVADHFADSFVKRFPSFDPGAWSDRTGGRVGRSKLVDRAEEERKARVARYLEATK